jgi:chromosome segregation ATPase
MMAGLTSLTLAFALLLPAQAPPAGRPARRDRTRAPSVASEAMARATEAAERTTREVSEMRRAVEAMADEVRLLRREMSARTRADRRVRGASQLLQLEESLARLKRELATTRERLRAAQGREDSARLQLANIDNEIIGAGGVNRADTERAIREALNRQINAAQEDQRTHERDAERLAGTIEMAENEANLARERLAELPESTSDQPEAEVPSDRDEPPVTRDGDGSAPPDAEPPAEP